ncbi:MBOAT family O-acyltransferase [Ferruginibacter sp.]|nr:MBOAT family protein [Ferruginibacter sp.]
MLFNSLVFAELLFITFVLYYQKWLLKYQVLILIIASLVFYAYTNPALLILLLFSAGINVASSYYVAYGNAANRKLIATAGVVFNLTVLAFFKYSPLIAKSLFPETSSVGEFLLTIPLPIGISFYTFEGISLLVDVYKEKKDDDKSLANSSFKEHAGRTLFFISFFPHLVSGPILKAHDFLPQIKAKFLKDINWEQCFKNLILGYFLKMVVADNLKDFTFWIAFPYFQRYTAITLITMLFGYSCQIFADFAGYSLIAIGLAQLFGYNLINNFNFPYISSSIQEFWKRWHISLSSFLMEYLYFPLGGNRKGKVRTYINLMITMFLGGLWHGAAWSYAVWGLVHGSALAIERMFKDKIKLGSYKVVVFFKRILVFCLVTFAWLFFKLPDFSQVIIYLKKIATTISLTFYPALCFNILLYSSPVFLYHLVYLLKKNKKFEASFNKYSYILYAIMLFLIVTNSGSSGSFIYFQF